MRRRSANSRIVPSDITPQEQYLSRRDLIAGGLGLAAIQSIGGFTRNAVAQASAALAYAKNATLSVTEAPNSYTDITTYNNYYEFGTDKSDPSQNAQKFRTSPWNVTVGGEAEVTGTFSLEDILKANPLEERIYRLRCVEAWSMVVPWVGFPLGDWLKRFKPTS
jgi:sulfoxide reductase catalytic subunit YedY